MPQFSNNHIELSLPASGPFPEMMTVPLSGMFDFMVNNNRVYCSSA